MTEVSTITIIEAKPGSAAAVEQVLGHLPNIARTPAGYPRYTSQRGLEDLDVFIAIERWDSKESVASHLAHPTVGDLLEGAKHLLAAPPRVIYLRDCEPVRATERHEDAGSNLAGERVRAATG